MPQQDLTTLTRVRAWLGFEDDNTSSDKELMIQISRMSASTLSWLNIPTLLNVQYDEILSGVGSNRIMLRNRPVTSIVSLNCAGVSIPANPNPPGMGSGYTLTPWNGYAPAQGQTLILNGYAFNRGQANIALSYMAGYKATLAAVTIPGEPYQVLPEVPAGLFAKDMGVLIDGVAAEAVTDNPAAGQYVAADPLNADPNTGAPVNPNYTFASADAGKTAIITCSYVPLTIEQAVCELVGERWRYKDRIGQSSKSLGGQETVSFHPNDFPLWFRQALQPFRLMVPLG